MSELINLPRPPRHDATLDLRIEAELQRRRAEDLEARLVAQHPPTPRYDIRWIVGGILAGLAMLISALWSVFNLIWTDMMQRAAWDHQENMAALNAVVTPASETGDHTLVWVMVAVAAICFLIGALRR